MVRMEFKIIDPLLSSNTTYACYFVYKISEHMENPVEVKIKQLMLNYPPGVMVSGYTNVVYLSTPQSLVIGSDGAERSPNTMNKHTMVESPRRRKDGWSEVRLGEFSKHNIQDSRPWYVRLTITFIFSKKTLSF